MTLVFPTTTEADPPQPTPIGPDYTLLPQRSNGVHSISCVIEGCASVFRTNEPLAANARFICRRHHVRDQLHALGRSARHIPAEAALQGEQADPVAEARRELGLSPAEVGGARSHD